MRVVIVVNQDWFFLSHRLPLARAVRDAGAEVVIVLKRTYDRLKPDLVHHVTIKPVLYGTIAARIVGGMAVVNAVSGLGYAFTSPDVAARALRPVLKVLYRLALGHPKSRTIFQNPEDLSDLVEMGVVRRDQAFLIRGSGVDCSRFRLAPEPAGPPTVLLAARMLWDKGWESPILETAMRFRFPNWRPGRVRVSSSGGATETTCHRSCRRRV